MFSVNSASLHILLLAYALTIALDAFILFLHIIKPYPAARRQSFDPSKLTVFIVCYNGADIIARTINNALRQVPAGQIIVVSDNSSDDTVAIARSMGVQVYENHKNYNKSMSINRHIHQVRTPYTLILDDDTLIGETFIPTSLLDEGYSAVAFNVLPIPTGTLINKFQNFEYQKTMTIRKGVRAVQGSVGNVSGAIGLYHTADLREQSTVHSGQSGGEDQQRTILTHLEGEGKGVTYCDSTVLTQAPDTAYGLFKQRAYKWNTSAHENFLLMVKAVLHPRTPFMLKLEKGYALLVLITEPFKLLAFSLLLFAPVGSFVTHMALIWMCYLGLELASWLKIGRKSPLWLVILFPFYGKFCSIARAIAHFYWYKKKFIYSVKNKFHRLIFDRYLLREYMLVTTVLVTTWIAASYALYLRVFAASPDEKLMYKAPQWQPLEGIIPNTSAFQLVLGFFAAWLIIRLLVVQPFRFLRRITFSRKASDPVTA